MEELYSFSHLINENYQSGSHVEVTEIANSDRVVKSSRITTDVLPDSSLEIIRRNLIFSGSN